MIAQDFVISEDHRHEATSQADAILMYKIIHDLGLMNKTLDFTLGYSGGYSTAITPFMNSLATLQDRFSFFALINCSEIEKMSEFDYDIGFKMHFHAFDTLKDCYADELDQLKSVILDKFSQSGLADGLNCEFLTDHTDKETNFLIAHGDCYYDFYAILNDIISCFIMIENSLKEWNK